MQKCIPQKLSMRIAGAFMLKNYHETQLTKNEMDMNKRRKWNEKSIDLLPIATYNA